MARIVIDAGHGGNTQVGNSTAWGTRGPSGTHEKEITFDIARRVASHLRGDAILTRSSDHNLSIGERADRGRDADVFVSIHTNSGPPDARGAETYVHHEAGSGSRALASRIQRALDGLDRGRVGARRSSSDPREAMMAVLTPSMLGRGTSACLVEVDYLSSRDGEARLCDAGHRQAIGHAIADAIRDHLGHGGRLGGAAHALSQSFDVRYNDVQLIPQQTEWSCWAASTAMVVGWSQEVSIDPSEIARRIGHWNAYHKSGLDPEDVQVFQAWNMTYHAPQSYSVDSFRQMLETYGPIWVAARVGGPHIRVVYGLAGDGTPDGTTVYIHDPWERGMTVFRPSNRGSSYTVTYAQFVAEIETLARSESGVAQPVYIAHMAQPRQGYGRRHGQSGQLAQALSIIEPDIDYTATTLAQANAIWVDWLDRYGRWRKGVPDTSYFPHSAICQLRVTSSDGRNGIGTGFFIGDGKILTAGHNFVLPSRNWRTVGVTVSPGLNGNFTLPGMSVASGWTLHPIYDRTTQAGNYTPDFDLAVLRVDMPAPGGSFELTRSTPAQDQGIVVCGYGSAEGLPVDRQYMDGARISGATAETITYPIQTVGGHSGSPVFWPANDHRVVAVHISGFGDHANRGCRLTPDKNDWIDSV